MGNATSKKLGRETWVKDECVSSCHKCLAEFGMSTRRHHCRACGNVFCAACCSGSIGYTPPARRGEPGYVEKVKRVCKACLQDILAEGTPTPSATPRGCDGDAGAAAVPPPEDAAVVAAADVGGELQPGGVSAADPAHDGAEDTVSGIGGEGGGEGPGPDGADALDWGCLDLPEGFTPVAFSSGVGAPRCGEAWLGGAHSDSTSAEGNEPGTSGAAEVDSSEGRASQLSDTDVALDSTPTGAMAASQGSSGGEPEVGDIVVLGPGVPPRFRQRPAVVVEVGEGCCAVTVLDDARRFAVGACRPTFADVRRESRLMRLGTRVVVDGLQGAKSQPLNGLTGEIAGSQRMGHPLFVSTKGTPQLMTYVRLDRPPAGSDKSVLLEPRFLAPCDDGVSA